MEITIQGSFVVKKFSKNTEECLNLLEPFLLEPSVLQSLHCDCVYCKHVSRSFIHTDVCGKYVYVVINSMHSWFT